MAKRRRQRGGAGGARRSRLRRGLRFALVGAGTFAVLSAAYAVTIGGQGDALADRIAGIGDASLNLAGLTVQDVTVTGRHYTSAHEILEALGAKRGEPITAIDVAAARQRLIELDWIRTASVTRFYPNTIHVSVEEFAPLAVWQTGGRTVLIDERGIVISSLDVRSFPHLPMVVGPGAAEAAPSFLAALEQRPAISSRVHSALRVGARRWSLRLDDGLVVHLPEEGVELALDELIGINERTGLLRRDITVVDMRVPDRVTVMPADAADDIEAGAVAGKRPGANT